MGMCPDGNCPECVASRERIREVFSRMSAEMRAAGARSFMQKVDFLIIRDRQKRADEWRKDLENRLRISGTEHTTP